MAKNKTCSAPGGCSITRSRGTFTCNWSGSYNDHVNCQYALLENGSYNYSGAINLGANATTYTINLDPGWYFPYTNKRLTDVTFRVQGDNKKTKKYNWKMSPWTGWNGLAIWAPANPVVTFERSQQYYTTFTINIPNHVNDRNWWSSCVEYRTCLRINKNDSSASDVNEWGPITRVGIYNSITQSDTTTFTYVVNEADLGNTAAIENANSAVRWFEARVCGPAGPSGWSPISLSYSEPYPAEIVKGVAKPNSRNGVDCSLDFNYTVSVSRPIDSIKVQYSYATPEGAYGEYTKTEDTEIDSEKTYYTLTTEKVSNPINDSIGTYYEIVEKYSTTTDRSVIDPEKTYYQATKVESPIIGNIDNYFECNILSKVQRVKVTKTLPGVSNEMKAKSQFRHKYNNVGEVNFVKRDANTFIAIYYKDEVVGYNCIFEKTLDIVINDEDDYYTISEVENPTSEGLPEDDSSVTPTNYIEREKYLIQKTTDKTVVKGKKYYTVTPTIILDPIISDIDDYYEITAINYMGPLSPSWQDAEIGSDNTITPKKGSGTAATYLISTSFSIDAEPPTDQLLYTRVNTIYNNQTTNGSYYLCTDDEGNIAAKDNLLSPPSFSGQVTPGSTNHFQLQVTNNSNAKGVKIAVVFIPPEGEGSDTETIHVAIPNQNGEVNDVIEVPPKYMSTSFGLGIYAFIGQHSLVGRITEDNLGYDLYVVKPIIRSDLVTYGGEIPVPPTNMNADHIGNGNVLVTWDWNWKKADYAEIAWSDYSEALDSNEPPNTYQVPNSKNSRLIVRNLEVGKTWYFWGRLGKEENVSIWSNAVYENLSSSPSIPTLSLSRRYITLDDKFNANWTYISTDGTPQQSAKISCVVDGNYGYNIAEIPEDENSSSETQYVVLDPNDVKLSWEEGHDYYLAVQVTSASGMISDWSETVPITVVKSIESSLSSTSLYPSAIDYSNESTYEVGDYAIKLIDDPDDPSKQKGILYKCISDITEAEEWNEEHWAIDTEQPYLELNALPLTASMEVSDDTANTSIIIERSQDYYIDRPDGSTISGYAGESVARMIKNTDDSFVLNQEDLASYLDDGAYYYLTTRVTDTYGQLKEVRYEFKVNWDHQALMPVANTTIDNTYSVIKIDIGTPEIPDGDDVTGDVCDIYRKSSDGYVLLYRDAEFDSTYVDPYPTLGNHGGYRVVYRTRNGDYITVDKASAWVDLDDEEDMIYSPSHIITFDGNSVELMFNVDIDNNWRKDFQETHYLGGSIQGDWNSGVSKTTSMSVNVLSKDWDVVSSMRNLAQYNGICHVRTRDGSNFLANVDVSEKAPYAMYTDPQGVDTQLFEYSLNITKLDPVEPDGMTLEEWLDTINDEDEE